MPCPITNKYKPKNFFSRLLDTNREEKSVDDINSKIIKWDELLSGVMLKDLGLNSADFGAWCLDKDLAIDLFKGITTSSGPSDDDVIPAGHTYLGQLITHDLMGETENSEPSAFRFPLHLGIDTCAPLKTKVKPELNLDTIYPPSYQEALTNSYIDKFGYFKLHAISGDRNHRSKKLALSERDLYRPAGLNGWPVVADRRNAENIILAQLVNFFLRLHNKALLEVYADGVVVNREEAYEQAKAFVTLLYQRLIIDEFLPSILGDQAVSKMSNLPENFLAKFKGVNVIPLEFSQAVFRFGHSMIRPTYELKVNSDKNEILDRTLLASDKVISKRFLIDWQRFFWHGKHTPNFASKIDLQVVGDDSDFVAKSKCLFSNYWKKINLFVSHIWIFSRIEFLKNLQDRETIKENMRKLVLLDMKASQVLPSAGQLLDILERLLSEPNLQDYECALNTVGINGLNGFKDYKKSIDKVMCCSRFNYLNRIKLENLPLSIFIYVEAEATNLNSSRRLGPLARLLIILVFKTTLLRTAINIDMEPCQLEKKLGSKLYKIYRSLESNHKITFKDVNNYLTI